MGDIIGNYIQHGEQINLNEICRLIEKASKFYTRIGTPVEPLIES